MFVVNKKMPKSCANCPLTFISYDNDYDYFCIFFDVKEPIQDYTDSRHPNCPLLQVKKKTKKKVLKANKKSKNKKTKKNINTNDIS